MYLVILVCFGLVLTRGEMQKVKLPIYTPPSPEEILNTYFHSWNETAVNRTKKSILTVSEKYYKTLEAMKKELSANLTNLENNSNFTFAESLSKNQENFVGPDLLKNILMASIEPTTYRYPTAVWSSHTYEKLKNNQKFRPRNLIKPEFTKPTVNPLYVYLGRDSTSNGSENTQKRNRGRIKFRKDNVNNLKKNESDFADKFLEQSLAKYLLSSNLKQSVGNVSVKTFSEILKNITDNKPKKLQSPYDENKELRMKFREEVILKKKNDTKPQGKFLEKQLQKRLEKVQDVFGEMNKEKILTNMWKYMTLNRSTETSDKVKNKTMGDTNYTITSIKESQINFSVMTSPQYHNFSVMYTTTDKSIDEISKNNYNLPEEEITKNEYKKPEKEFIKNNNNKESINYINRNNSYFQKSDYHNETTNFINKNFSHFQISHEPKKKGKSYLKLTAEESSYYNNKRQFPSLTFIGQQEKPGMIPGTPQIDYPTFSFPPVTRFKCPSFKDGKPKMMADKATRCQVFYICTGDGPTTAMLCPNGTMFNENFLVCDWWYNVHC